MVERALGRGSNLVPYLPLRGTASFNNAQGFPPHFLTPDFLGLPTSSSIGDIRLPMSIISVPLMHSCTAQRRVVHSLGSGRR